MRDADSDRFPVRSNKKKAADKERQLETQILIGFRSRSLNKTATDQGERQLEKQTRIDFLLEPYWESNRQGETPTEAYSD